MISKHVKTKSITKILEFYSILPSFLAVKFIFNYFLQRVFKILSHLPLTAIFSLVWYKGHYVKNLLTQ